MIFVAKQEVAVQVDFAGETAVQGYFGGESDEKLAQLCSNFKIQLQQDIVSYSLKQKNGSCLKEKIMMIAKLDDQVAAVIHCLVERKRRRADRQKKYANTYKRILDSVDGQ